MSRLSYPRESSVYLEHLHPPCAQGARGAARSSHLASRLPAAFPEVGKAKWKWAASPVLQLGPDHRAGGRLDSSPHTVITGRAWYCWLQPSLSPLDAGDWFRGLAPEKAAAVWGPRWRRGQGEFAPGLGHCLHQWPMLAAGHTLNRSFARFYIIHQT